MVSSLVWPSWNPVRQHHWLCKGNLQSKIKGISNRVHRYNKVYVTLVQMPTTVNMLQTLYVAMTYNQLTSEAEMQKLLVAISSIILHSRK